jgi:hypothetical protein
MAGLTAELDVRPAGNGDPFEVRHPIVRVWRNGILVGASLAVQSLAAGYRAPYGVDLDEIAVPGWLNSLCLARMTGDSVDVVVGIRIGNNCCEGVELIPIYDVGLGTGVFDPTEGAEVTLRTFGGAADIVSSDWNGCTYEACAGGAAPIVIQSFDGRVVRDATSSHPGQLRRDARALLNDSLRTRQVWLSGLAGWVEDECRLAREADAWARVDRLLGAHRLESKYAWVRGQRFVRLARKLLAERGVCP